MFRRRMPNAPHPCPNHARITLVTTSTIDRLHLPGGSTLDLPGGPALYLAQALTRLGRPYRLITGPRATAQVLPGPRYIIPPLPPIPLPCPLPGEVVILDPVGNEIDPYAIPPLSGELVIDLQGFVRVPNIPSDQPGPLVDLQALLGRAAVVKAAEAEVERLDEASRAALAGTTLLLTRGAAGAVVRWPGGEHTVTARPVETTHTIGAGDTFLAAFVAARMDGCDRAAAAERAARFTERILRGRAAQEAEV